MKLRGPEGVCAHTSVFVFTFMSVPSSHDRHEGFSLTGQQ